MRKHAFLYQRHACRINVVTSRAKSRLCDAILQHHNRPSAADDDRTSGAKIVQRMGIENVKVRRGRSAIELRR
jgi:hypothetical protein